MRRDRSYWKVVCLLGFSATVSTGLLAANPNEDQGVPATPTGRQDSKVQDVLRQALLAPDKAKETGDPILDGILQVIQERGSIVEAWLPEAPDFDASGDSQAIPEPKIDHGQHPLPQLRQAEPFAAPQLPQSQHPRSQLFNSPHSPQGQPPIYPSLTPGQPPHPFVQPSGHGRAGMGDGIPSPQQEQQFLLAEQLLMTARLLSTDLDQQRGHGFSNGMGHDAGQRRQLIRMLREEAARCLNTQSRTPAQPPSPHANNAPIPNPPVYLHRD